MIKNKVIKTILWTLVILVIIFVSYHFLLSKIYTEPADRGTFGDSYGALNALISALAFGCFIYTILIQQEQLKMQREELALQRNELELTRKELTRSAIAQEKSEQALSEQVESMKLTSEISYYTTLMNTYNILITHPSPLPYQEQTNVKGKIQKLYKKIESYEKVIK